jgi:hypothetical protein
MTTMIKSQLIKTIEQWAAGLRNISLSSNEVHDLAGRVMSFQSGEGNPAGAPTPAASEAGAETPAAAKGRAHTK